MATTFTERTDAQLTWSETRARITLLARQRLNRVLNVALAEAARQHDAAIQRGELIEWTFEDQALDTLLLTAARDALSDA